MDRPSAARASPFGAPDPPFPVGRGWGGPATVAAFGRFGPVATGFDPEPWAGGVRFNAGRRPPVGVEGCCCPPTPATLTFPRDVGAFEMGPRGTGERAGPA